MAHRKGDPMRALLFFAAVIPLLGQAPYGVPNNGGGGGGGGSAANNACTITFAAATSVTITAGGSCTTGSPNVHPFERNGDRKSTRLNSSHSSISYAVFCLKKK